MKIEPISRYYFDGKAYCLRSKWPSRIKALISIFLLCLTLTVTTNLAAPNPKTFSDQKDSYVEYILDQGKSNRLQANKIVESTLRWANQYKVDERLILAVARIESNFYNHAISSTGAMGIMQIIPSWHREKIREAKKDVGTPEIFDISTNIYLGTRVLRECLDRNNKNINKALQCYSGNTLGYDKKVLAEYSVVKRL